MTTDNESTADCPRLRHTDPTEFTDPYPAWAESRRDAPVFWDDRLGYWQITRHADVAAAVMNTTELSSEGFFALTTVIEGNEHLVPRGFEWQTPSLANADPPVHTRIRRRASDPFKARRVATLEPDLRAIAQSLIDGFAGDAQCELIEQFAVPYSLRTIAAILGMPEADAAEMRRYSDEKPATFKPGITKAEQAAILEHYGTYTDFLERAIDRVRSAPGDNLLSDLVREGSDAAPMSDAELISLVGILIGAGNETTRYLIGNMMLLLLRHPDQLEALLADRSLVPNAVEETLRYFSSVKGNLRKVTADFTIAGVTLPEGSLVQLCWGSTGRDAEVFERADEFDIHRTDAKAHIAFSRGPHVCLGAALARLEAKVALECLLDRLPGLRLVREPAYPGDYVSTVQVQGVRTLQLAWSTP